jgi:hypothetical protein
MKKLLLILLLAALLSACGPKRLGCGPNRRCSIEKSKDPESDKQKNPAIAGFLYLY